MGSYLDEPVTPAFAFDGAGDQKYNDRSPQKAANLLRRQSRQPGANLGHHRIRPDDRSSPL